MASPPQRRGGVPVLLPWAPTSRAPALTPGRATAHPEAPVAPAAPVAPTTRPPRRLSARSIGLRRAAGARPPVLAPVARQVRSVEAARRHLEKQVPRVPSHSWASPRPLRAPGPWQTGRAGVRRVPAPASRPEPRRPGAVLASGRVRRTRRPRQRRFGSGDSSSRSWGTWSRPSSGRSPLGACRNACIATSPRNRSVAVRTND
jgi:hypothetical protein